MVAGRCKTQEVLTSVTLSWWARVIFFHHVCLETYSYTSKLHIRTWLHILYIINTCIYISYIDILLYTQGGKHALQKVHVKVVYTRIKRRVIGRASRWFAGISTRGKSPSCTGEEPERKEQKRGGGTLKGCRRFQVFFYITILFYHLWKENTLRCYSH